MSSPDGIRIVSARELISALEEQPGSIGPTAQRVLAPGFPDLPDFRPPVGGFPVAENPGTPRFREGCYAIAFTPTARAEFAWPPALGTLRLECPDRGWLIASGDLYRPDVGGADLVAARGVGAPPAFAVVEPAVPIFPRTGYHAYLRIDAGFPTELARWKGAASWGVACSWHRLRSMEFNVWNPAEWTLWRLRSPEPEEVDEAETEIDAEVGGRLREHAEFEVLDAQGVPVGQVVARWQSPFFREARVEVDSESGVPAALDNGAGETWTTAFERVGWRVRAEAGTLEGVRPASGRWTYAELHEAMVRSRTDGDLDRAWRYHVSVVRHFAENPAPLGIAFDHEASDRNGVPREGVAVNAGAGLPPDPAFGRYAGHVVMEHPELLFHIAVHEVGHAMGLYHNQVGCGVMDPLGDRPAHSATGVLDPGLLSPQFSADDIVRLRHLPDIYVRPGGTTWETQGVVDDHEDAFGPVAGLFRPLVRAESRGGLELALTVVGERLPVSAPVRVDFELRNRAGVSVGVPDRLSLATPHIRGWVVGPDGTENEFRSLFKPVVAMGLVELASGAAKQGSVTLLRGHRGALFARPGGHVVWLEIAWSHAGLTFTVRGAVRVDVFGSREPAEARAARRLVRTPETLGYLVLGRSRAFAAGERAIDEALDAEGLRHHYAFIRARALATPHFEYRVDWRQVGMLLEGDSALGVLNRKEARLARHYRDQARGGDATTAALASTSVAAPTSTSASASV